MNFLALKGSTPQTNYKGVTEIAFGGLHEYILKYFLDVIPISSSVLDLGCGKGAWTLRLADQGYNVTACDLNAQIAEVPCLSVNLNDEFANNFGTTRFDAISFIEVIEHLENPRNALRQTNKLLNDGGKLLLSTPNASGLYSRIRFLLTGEFSSFDDTLYHSIGHIRPITYWELEKILEESGFRILKVVFYDFTPFFPKTLGDIFKKVSWLIRPFMSGVVGTSDIIILAEKKVSA
jgi:2-polyprenyl-3-methyl-5-hydroxy-6-metoxy-1,4-benzoquinol methylase